MRRIDVKRLVDAGVRICGVPTRLFRVSFTGELVFEILPEGDKDLRADIFKAAVAADLVLLGLEHQGENLEDIFRDLTRVGEA